MKQFPTKQLQIPVMASPIAKTAREELIQRDLARLARMLSDAILECTEAVAARNQIEIEIAALILSPDSDQKTVSLDDGTKITVKRRLTYKADLEKIETAMRKATPEDGGAFLAPVKQKTIYELDVQGYEWYRRNQPTIFARIAKYVTVTPRKVSISLETYKEKI